MQSHYKVVATILFLLNCALLSSCAQTGPQPLAALPFPLLSPASFGQQLALTQQMTVQFRGEQHELLVYSDIAPQKISIVGTLPNSVRLFSITYDGESVFSETYGGLIDHLGADYFLADFQLALWPLDVLQEGLAQDGNCFVQQTCSLQQSTDKLKRTLRREGEELVSIQYSGLPRYEGSIHFVQQQRGYTLEIKTLEAILETQ